MTTNQELKPCNPCRQCGAVACACPATDAEPCWCCDGNGFYTPGKHYSSPSFPCPACADRARIKELDACFNASLITIGNQADRIARLEEVLATYNITVPI